MKFLIDMNLGPNWRPILRSEGWESVHHPPDPPQYEASFSSSSCERIGLER